jgi:predicted AAA+ superfamily ATPase
MPDQYLRRIVDDELDELLLALPALAIEGAKAVGKTRTATERARTAHRFTDPRVVELFRADRGRLVALDRDPPVLIDEWQRLPESWDLVRDAVDAGAPPGFFLLTGSAAERSASQDGGENAAAAAVHSGAGRIPRVRMRPLTLAERGVGDPTVSLVTLLGGDRPAVTGETDVRLGDYVEQILISGFPAIRELEGRAHRTQLDGYIDRVIDRDFPDELGLAVRNPTTLRRWMTAYAAAVSQTVSFETIRAAASGSRAGDAPARKTALSYRAALERLWLLEPVPAWLPTRNYLSRLGVAAKHQLTDPALAARLLGVDADSLLEGRDAGPPIPRDGSLLGALFESLVTLNVRVYAQQAEAEVRHLRTHSGEHEVDLIVERADGRVVAIEVKLAETVDGDALRHLNWLAAEIGADLLDRVVVTTGRAAYRRDDGIAVVPAALLGP